MRIGVDLGGTKIEGIILADTGSVIEKIRVDTPGEQYQATLEAVCKVVDQLQAHSSSLLSVGIGTPGTLSLPSELMKNCNSICLNGQPLQKDIEASLGYAIRMENDANCFALSEAHFGAGKDSGTVFGVILGTGTGGGIVVNRQLLTGANHIAGEWGHNSIPHSAHELIAEDRTCYCGRRNCIETVLSGRGLSQTFSELTARQLEAIEIARLAESGEKAAIDCIQRYCQQLARCLATVINVVDPDVIILGGGLSNIAELYRAVPAYLQDFVFTDVIHTRLSPPGFGDASGARGAACLWDSVRANSS
ncbi:MAG TPA: ROK family protein [Gammaproteobacteria bacterium]|jgi:predicted NBD/HSP70 family sugar kinase|nr:ROK family protein [Gammaproteobacteria bacterium]|tara:strand:+ start:1314 stop:2231 length:918 start_codon:yes stop_codon:yes gene_type:complete